MSYPKIIETPHYHLWTDALHACTLAHEAKNHWDQGTYVRWCVITAWTVLEIACQDATGDASISYRFKANLDNALSNMELPPLDWSSGIWQRVQETQKLRKIITHRFVTDAEQFPAPRIADDTIETIRSGIECIYAHVNRPAPHWVADNDARGWDKGSPASYNLVLKHNGADPQEADTIKVCCVRNGQEFTSDVLPAGSDWKPVVEGLLNRLNHNFPIQEVRVYSGTELVCEQPVNMRGA